MRTRNPYLLSVLNQGLLSDFILTCRKVKKVEVKREQSFLLEQHK